jgi:hypothetical protein
MIARARGFDAARHCVIVANNSGCVVVAECERYGWLCEQCPKGRAWGMRWPTSKAWKREQGK